MDNKTSVLKIYGKDYKGDRITYMTLRIEVSRRLGTLNIQGDPNESELEKLDLNEKGKQFKNQLMTHIEGLENELNGLMYMSIDDIFYKLLDVRIKEYFKKLTIITDSFFECELY